MDALFFMAYVYVDQECAIRDPPFSVKFCSVLFILFSFILYLIQAIPGRPMPGVRQQQHNQNQYRNNRGQQPSNRHAANHVPYGGHMNTSQASQVKFHRNLVLSFSGV